MSYANYDDVLIQLRNAGLIVAPPLNLEAKIQRWKVEDEGVEKRGWSRLREWQSNSGKTYIVGVYGVWHGNDDGKCKITFSKNDDDALTDDDRAAMRAAHKEAEKKLEAVRKSEVKRAAQWAAAVWAKSTPCESHEYLNIKHIKPHGLRILPDDTSDMTLEGIDESNYYRIKAAAGALIVPMHDAKGVIQGLQFIYAKGHPRRTKIERDKEFWPTGMAMGGTFGLIGSIRREGIMLIAEGYATAASLHEATGQSVAYAFSANNLIKAGRQLAKDYPRLRLLFCADDDYLTEGNPGCSAAAASCAAIENSAWVKPTFPTDAAGLDQRGGKKLTDFNDLLVMTGFPLTLADQINAKLDEMKWRDAVPRAGSQPQGGGESGGRRKALSVMPINEAIERFVPLDDGTGKYLFDKWTNKVVMKEQMQALLPAGVRWDDVKRDPDWVARGAYFLDQVGFDPSGKDENVQLNTWNGWPLKPKRGSCVYLLELLEYLCSGESNSHDVYKWLLCWMAYPLQNPGAKMSSAVIMHGPQGTGKSTVFQALSKIYGDYSTVLNQRGLEDKFNSDWSDSKLFILAEEVVTRAEMWHIKNELKELVTGEWIRINPKNIAAYRQRNHINVVYLSNEGQPLPLENDDRRHLVVWTPPMLPAEYYDNVFIEMENGGIQAFYDYLLGINLSDFHPKKRPPMTDSKQRLIDLSVSNEFAFIKQYLDGELGYPVCPSDGMDLFAAYMRWCRDNNERNQRNQRGFASTVCHMPGWDKKRVQIMSPNGSRKPVTVYIPPSAVLQANGFSQKVEETETLWFTRSVQAFKNAFEKSES
jgi:putative DNA primase/helicase